MNIKKLLKEVKHKMSDIITVKINGGLIIARKSSDSDYPGIDVEFVSDKENPKNLSRPRVLFEKPKDQELRALVCDCKNEDYSSEIIFNK